MKSLLKSACCESNVVRAEQVKSLASANVQEEAQCCAKVSKTVAGCHD